jgi:ketosteroid isomerase-like protein
MSFAHDATMIAEELDAMHRRAIEHYRNKDVGAYMQLFASDLRYRQLNGVEIGREQLTRDVEAQFSRVESADSFYKRESLSIEGDCATEHLEQIASATVRVFLFFQRTWRVRRSGRYTWAKSSDGWRIQTVEVLDERITSGAA